jgi:bifunctional non-homologous end joining protein LigD
LVEKLKPAPKPAKLRPGASPGAVKAPAPDRIAPQLATQSDRPPNDDGWLHEIKLDGYRTIARVSGGQARLITRTGLDWTKRYGNLADAFTALPCREAIIDGEIVVLDEDGISRFALLQDALSEGHGHKLVYFAFDLLHLDGWDLTKVPLEKRKELLAQLLAGQVTQRSAVQFSDHVMGGGQAFYERVSEMGLEGIISKRASATYQEGRSRTWMKTKALKAGDFVIAGYTTSQAAEGLAALALAEWDEGELQYRGKCGTGFDAETLRRLLARLQALGPGEKLDGAPRDIIWVRPVLSARIHYSNRTGDDLLRHAVFKGLREAELSGTAPVERKRFI